MGCDVCRLGIKRSAIEQDLLDLEWAGEFGTDQSDATTSIFNGDVVALFEDGPAIEPESEEDLYLTDPKNGDLGMFLGVPRIGNAL